MSKQTMTNIAVAILLLFVAAALVVDVWAFLTHTLPYL